MEKYTTSKEYIISIVHYHCKSNSTTIDTYSDSSLLPSHVRLLLLLSTIITINYLLLYKMFEIYSLSFYYMICFRTIIKL